MGVKTKKRILIAKVGLDGHDRGAKVLSSILRDEGFKEMGIDEVFSGSLAREVAEYLRMRFQSSKAH